MSFKGSLQRLLERLGLSGEGAISTESLSPLVALAATEQSAERLPELVLNASLELFNPSYACVYTPSERPGLFRARSVFPTEYFSREDVAGKFLEWREDQGSVGRAVRERSVVAVFDPEKEHETGQYVPFADDAGTELVLPILAHDRLSFAETVVAVLVLARSKQNPFTERDLQVARLAGPILMAAFNRAVARERRDKRLDFLKSLSDVTFEDSDQQFERFLESLVRLTEVRFASLWLRSRQSGADDVLLLQSFFPGRIGDKQVTFDSFDRSVLECKAHLSGESAESAKARVFSDITRNPKFANPKFAKRYGLRWMVSIPVLAHSGEVEAVLNLWPKGDPEAFDEGALETVSSYVSPLATLVRVSELLSEEKELESFEQIVNAVVRVEKVSEPWDDLARLLREQLQCEGCSIFLEERRNLRLKGTTGIEGIAAKSDVVYEPGEGLTGTAFERNRVLIYYAGIEGELSRAHKSKHRESTKGRSKSILFAPIRDGSDNPIGVIRCTNRLDGRNGRIKYFTPRDGKQLEKMARAISILLGKARWMQEREKEWHSALLALHHELLSPVDTFIAHSQWVQAEVQKAERGGTLNLERLRIKAQDLADSAQLAEVLIASLGQLDRDLKMKMKEVDFRRIVEACKGALLGEAGRKEVSIDTSAVGSFSVLGDKRHLMRIVFNLLRNAVKYSDPSEQSKEIRVVTWTEGREAVLSVEDNGIGVSEVDQKSIFRKFARGRNASSVFPEGTGLGLYYCSVIARAHGGEIRLARLHKPTEFHVRILRAGGRDG